MTTQFTTPCYVRVDDKNKRKEICEKLEPIGYKIKVDYTNDINPIVVASKLGILYDASRFKGLPDFIDCGTNTDLFLALAGMRSNTDYMQWFTDGTHWYKNISQKKEIGGKFIIDGYLCHKATAAEIIGHFKQQGE